MAAIFVLRFLFDFMRLRVFFSSASSLFANLKMLSVAKIAHFNLKIFLINTANAFPRFALGYRMRRNEIRNLCEKGRKVKFLAKQTQVVHIRFREDRIHTLKRRNKDMERVFPDRILNSARQQFEVLEPQEIRCKLNDLHFELRLTQNELDILKNETDFGRLKT
jgi:hypothetical protein